VSSVSAGEAGELELGSRHARSGPGYQREQSLRIKLVRARRAEVSPVEVGQPRNPVRSALMPWMR